MGSNLEFRYRPMRASTPTITSSNAIGRPYCSGANLSLRLGRVNGENAGDCARRVEFFAFIAQEFSTAATEQPVRCVIWNGRTIGGGFRMIRKYMLGLMAACLVSPSFAQTRPAQIVRADGAQIEVRLSGDWSRCGPTLIQSHGLGGSWRALDWLDRAAQEAGYRVMRISHAESGISTLRLALRGDIEQVLADRDVWRARAADLQAAVAFAKQSGCQPVPLVLGGHSMGAANAMFEAGAKGRHGYTPSGKFDAFIAVSPQGPGTWAFDGTDAWRNVRAPVLLLTGPEDRMRGGDDPENRMRVLDLMPAGNKRLGVIAGADHGELGGRRASPEGQVAGVIAGEFLTQLRTGLGPSRLKLDPKIAVIRDR